MFKNDVELFSYVEKNIYVAAVCDILDELGYRNQAMHQRIRPLLFNPEECGFIGRARTFRWMEIDYVPEENPYGLEIEAMDSLKSGDVVVHSTDFAGSNAPWGELMSTISKYKGVRGCVCDSQIRDCVKIMKLGFPVYYSGIRPLDSKGRGIVQAYDVPILCGGVKVNYGDIIFADFDGVVVIPKEIDQEVFSLAMEKVNKENLSRKELLLGKSLREVYDKYQSL